MCKELHTPRPFPPLHGDRNRCALDLDLQHKEFSQESALSSNPSWVGEPRESGMGRQGAPRVSVVIPTYNRASLLMEAVNSVLAQSYGDFELIVVDDGSTDDTADRLRQLPAQLRYAYQCNRGVAAARNYGIRLARGEYICFLDSDDLWKRNKLSEQVAFADAHPQYGLICTEIEGFGTHGRIEGRSKSEIYKIRNGHVLDELLFSNWIQSSTVLVHRDCFARVGCFDEDVGQFGEDWLMWMRIAAEYPIYFMPEALVSYRVHQAALTMHLPDAQYDSLMRILKKLSTLQPFQQRQHLLDRAGYRIAMGRARLDLKAGEYTKAIGKLQDSCRLQRFPIRARVLLALASLKAKVSGDRSKVAAHPL